MALPFGANRAQRRPALLGRQPPGSGRRCGCPLAPLNEGRPCWAGNPDELDGIRARGRRSTKAGPVGPATPPRSVPRPARFERSTKAGPVGPATQAAVLVDVGIQGARSTKAGPVGPATLERRISVAVARISAQRRPALLGRQPLLPLVADAAGGHQRSTKAGPVGPATPDWSPAPPRRTLGAQRRPALLGRQPCPRPEPRHPHPTALNEGRPCWAGNPATMRRFPRNVTTAQRRPALLGRQPRVALLRGPAPLLRSTKAGPVGPATPPLTGLTALTLCALNEGRPCWAGNPAPHQLLGYCATWATQANARKARRSNNRDSDGLQFSRITQGSQTAIGPTAHPTRVTAVGRALFEIPGSVLRNDR